MENIHRTTDSTARVHKTVKSASSHQRKEARALKEKKEEEKKKKRSFHDELVLSDELAKHDDTREHRPESSEPEVGAPKKEPEPSEESDSVDDQGHVDCRA